MQARIPGNDSQSLPLSPQPTFTGIDSAGFFFAMSTTCANLAVMRGYGRIIEAHLTNEGRSVAICGGAAAKPTERSPSSSANPDVGR